MDIDNIKKIAKNIDWHDKNSIVKNLNIDKNLLNDYDFICKLYQVDDRILRHVGIDIIKKFILNTNSFYILNLRSVSMAIENQIMNDIDFMIELIKLDFSNIKYISEWHYWNELHSNCGCSCCR